MCECGCVEVGPQAERCDNLSGGWKVEKDLRLENLSNMYEACANSSLLILAQVTDPRVGIRKTDEAATESAQTPWDSQISELN